jgi:cell division protein FtsZ
MVLETEQPKAAAPVVQELTPAPVVEEKDPFAPSLQEPVALEEMLSIFGKHAPVELPEAVEERMLEEKESMVLQFELSTEITQEVVVEMPVAEVHVPRSAIDEMMDFQLNDKPSGAITVGTGLLSKPTNIYAEPEIQQPQVQVIEMKLPEPTPVSEPIIQKSEGSEMQLVMREPVAVPAPRPVSEAQMQASIEDDSMMDEVEEQKRRAAERIQKLRNLSFNMNNAADANNEFDAVPAYVRRNMELFGSTLTSVENFYSKYTVGKDENDQTQISTINTFLDGKKPD